MKNDSKWTNTDGLVNLNFRMVVITEVVNMVTSLQSEAEPMFACILINCMSDVVELKKISYACAVGQVDPSLHSQCRMLRINGVPDINCDGE